MRTEGISITNEVGKRIYRFVNSGSSKEVYQLIDDKSSIIKIPRALNDIYGLDGDKIDVYKPTSLDEVEDVLTSISEQSEGMVWPVGQLLVEIFVWEKLLQLEEEGYDISCFARLEDYYFDCDGIPVIKQEAVSTGPVTSEEWNTFTKKFDIISKVLKERWDIRIHDVREGNVGFVNGVGKLYDFGMINYIFDYYTDYDTYEEECYIREEEC